MKTGKDPLVFLYTSTEKWGGGHVRFSTCSASWLRESGLPGLDYLGEVSGFITRAKGFIFPWKVVPRAHWCPLDTAASDVVTFLKVIRVDWFPWNFWDIESLFATMESRVSFRHNISPFEIFDFAAELPLFDTCIIWFLTCLLHLSLDILFGITLFDSLTFVSLFLTTSDCDLKL